MGILLGICIGAMVGVIYWFLTPITYIKNEKVIIKLIGKRTTVPISDIKKIKGVDMLRGGYQIIIYSKKGTYYGRVGIWERFVYKLKQINPNMIVEEKVI